MNYTERERGLNTLQFLNIISRRLSGRKDDKGCEYHVNVSVSEGTTIVDMTPLFYVYPSRFHRKEIDKQTILDYAFNQMFSADGLKYSWNNQVQIVIESDCLVPGNYMYASYENANNRRYRTWRQAMNAGEAVRLAGKEMFL